MLLGLVHATGGTATIDGQRYVDLPEPLGTVGAALEATNFHPGRSGRDHLRVLADAGSVPLTRVDELLERTGIPAAARKRAGEYSMGMRQRLPSRPPSSATRGSSSSTSRPTGSTPRASAGCAASFAT